MILDPFISLYHMIIDLHRVQQYGDSVTIDWFN